MRTYVNIHTHVQLYVQTISNEVAMCHSISRGGLRKAYIAREPTEPTVCRS